MRRSIALALVLAVLWFLGSVWYYDCKIKRVCGPETLITAVQAVPAEVTETAPIALSSNAPVPAAASVPKTAVAHIALTAYFGRKSTDIVIPPASEALLPQLLEAVQQGHHLSVVGHSDARGSAELKAELSAQRAVILRDWLLAHGVPEKSITAVESHEDREPVADNATAEGRAQNRRAVATLQE